ncbi:MAG: HAMP domain-containing histidine kinase [Lachnospiraceae bacterium]|nr:HAMP domain-containing histidine kinase [Lachnospiraceae bacterium]
MDNRQNKRTRSITGKLHRAYLFRKIRFYIAEDILIALLLTIGAFLQQEYILTGSLVRNRSRWFRPNPDFTTDLERIFYTVAEENGTVVMEVYLFPILRVVSLVIAVIAAFQIISVLLSWFGDGRRIRNILRPLTDLAVRADELNRLSFGEDKYQRIEDAIERMQVNETEKLSFGDDDLRGIEAAMNNLLTRMREANMQQARFVNDASHELRTPIAVIQGYANMLDRWGKEDETVLDESIEAIKNESAHMNYLVEQLLFLARGDAGKTELHPEEIDCNAFLKEIYEESLMIDEKHPYRFVPYTETGADGSASEVAVTVSADRGLLKQAVRILVDNAAKYTAQGDEITLSAGFTDEDGRRRPYLQVQDAGCGMQDADITHMFERFYRSEDVRGEKGTGLGLSIAKWIVDKHGAHFEVLSRKGLGTRIRVVL